MTGATFCSASVTDVLLGLISPPPGQAARQIVPQFVVMLVDVEMTGQQNWTVLLNANFTMPLCS